MKKKERAVVLSQECIATDIYSMWIETPDIAAEAIPGQFITLYTKDADKLLPRPISLCEIEDVYKRQEFQFVKYRLLFFCQSEFLINADNIFPFLSTVPARLKMQR